MVYDVELEKEIPKGWKSKPIDTIADFLNGLPLQKYPPQKNDKKYLSVIKIKELKNGVTNSSDKASANIPTQYVVNNGDILFSWSGTLTVVIWTGGKGALNQHLFKVTSRDFPSWFCYYWIVQYLPEYQHIAEGKVTTMGHIQRYHLTESIVLIPNSETLQIMDEIISPLITQKILLDLESKTLTQIRDSLLPKLMSGKIRV